MRFILTSNGLAPTDGAIIPELMKRGAEAVVDQATDRTLDWVFTIGSWVADKGLFMLSEGLLVWGMFCFLMAITGKGPWMERGVKSLIGFSLVGVAAHAV